MKYSLLIALFSLFTFTNCSLGNDSNNGTDITYKTYWHLINVTGGLAGIDDDFDFDEIIWHFDDDNAKLVIENNNTDDSKEDGFNSGTYTYSTTEEGINSFLFIDAAEFGSYIFTSDNEFIIDQNLTTDGDAADGFEYTFKMVLVAQE